jgi:hypothetical protein
MRKNSLKKLYEIRSEDFGGKYGGKSYTKKITH